MLHSFLVPWGLGPLQSFFYSPLQVFPSFASTRDHMIVDGILPISQLKGMLPPLFSHTPNPRLTMPQPPTCGRPIPAP